ncbi:surface antigen-domain-containing protein [Suillus paluster]|uniref:surface antigen-domain-containing protein n=1 Tax=Suillus paluster TaxID=48578 RepID=UPI001B864CDA|nr:surface antigen-domain-containing protein [Suillus paluster]KAG1735590.1 surface antigen-domain-containing protein [Suillus paluster]
MTEGLRPPLQRTAHAHEPNEDDLEKLKKWQEARLERKLRGEYESAVFNLAELINKNLETPLTVTSVRVDGATNTRGSFLGWLIQPWLARHTDDRASKSNNLQGALYTARGISHILQETDLFHSVHAEIQRSRDHLAKDGDVDIVINTREKGRFYLKSATEFGNNEGSVSLTGRVRNVFGGAELLEGHYSAGTKTRRSFHGLLSLPLSPSLRTTGQISLFSLERDLSTFASCSEISHGLKAAINSDWGAHGVHEVAYQAVLRHINNLAPSASVSIREHAGQTIKSSISHTWTKDTRDDKLAASRGYYGKLFQELAGLSGDVSFYKAEIESQISRRLVPGMSLSLAVRSGILKALSGHSHFSDRFQLGGPLSLRSFRANSLGPRDGVDSLGGDIYWSTGASLVSDIPRKPHWPIKSHIFVNAGRLDAVDGTKGLGENIMGCLRRPSISAGVGLIYRFDPVRVEVNFGVPLFASKSDGVRRGFQVGIGMEFL